jgi:hypothetical protein
MPDRKHHATPKAAAEAAKGESWFGAREEDMLNFLLPLEAIDNSESKVDDKANSPRDGEQEGEQQHRPRIAWRRVNAGNCNVLPAIARSRCASGIRSACIDA